MKMGQSKSYGILFDVETASASSSPVTISGMDFYLDSTVPVHYEVWAKRGSWQRADGETSAGTPQEYKSGFVQVAAGTIAGRGSSDYTKIPIRDFKDVDLEGGGDRRSFYLTASDDVLVSKTYDGAGVSRHEMETIVQASNELFQVFYGTAVRAYPLESADPLTDFWDNSGFLGRLWYKEGSRD